MAALARIGAPTAGAAASESDPRDRELWYDLADLVRNPKLLEPPPAVVPRMAWQGRITLLSAREKAGKSTLAGAAAAAVARGDVFLGEKVPAGRVAWLALDEHLGDTVRRFHDLGLEHSVSLTTERPTLEELHPVLLGLDCRLLVIDTLNCYAAGIVEDTYRPEQWGPLFAGLRTAMRGTEACVLVIHHLKKNAPEFTGSQAIGAGVDVLLNLTRDESDPMLRKVGFQGRVHGEDFAVRFDPVRFAFTLDRGAPTLDAQVLAVVMREPGVGTRELRGRIPARASDVTAVLRRLEGEGYIENLGGKGANRWHPKSRGIGDQLESVGNHSGTTGTDTPGTAGNHAGTSGNHWGTTTEPGAVPAPIENRGREPLPPGRPELPQGQP